MRKRKKNLRQSPVYKALSCLLDELEMSGSASEDDDELDEAGAVVGADVGWLLSRFIHRI
jgi:hypothetical protein